MNIPCLIDLNDDEFETIMAWPTSLPPERKLTNLQRLIAYERRMDEMRNLINDLRRRRLLIDNRRRRAVEAVRREEVNINARDPRDCTY